MPSVCRGLTISGPKQSSKNSPIWVRGCVTNNWGEPHTSDTFRAINHVQKNMEVSD